MGFELSGDFRVGECIVRPQRRIIERAGRPVHVKPKAMAVLECLAAADNQPVTRSSLFEAVWPGGEITDDTLTHCVGELRRAFGETARDARYIETIPKLGFRLAQPALPLESVPAAPDATGPEHDTQRPALPDQTLRYRIGWRYVLTALTLLVLLLALYPPARLWVTERSVDLALKAAAVGSPAGFERQTGIAVLPFANISADPDNDYFADGMSAEIISALIRATDLPVISRNSSFQFKGEHRDVREIGRLLGVTHVIEGSVRRSGESIRLNAQLVDTATSVSLWSAVYQRELSDVFQLQNEIAGEIVEQIGFFLGRPAAAEDPSFAPTATSTTSMEAYQLYLRGMEMVMSTRPALIAESVAVFERAIAFDEHFADAWAGRGYALSILAWGGSGSTRIPASVYPEAIACFRSALQIDPHHARAMGYLGTVLMANDFKWAEGMALLKQATEISPNDAALLAIYGHYLGVMQLEGAEQVLERAYRLDPFGIQPITARFAQLLRDGRRLDAARLIDYSLIDDSKGYANNLFAAHLNVGLGRLDTAEERLQAAREVALPNDLNLDVLQWWIDYKRGRREFPLEEVWARMQSEHLIGAALFRGWQAPEHAVAVFDLAIEQRHPELRSVLFGPKPAIMPEKEWRRIREITGVNRFMASL